MSRRQLEQRIGLLLVLALGACGSARLGAPDAGSAVDSAVSAPDAASLDRAAVDVEVHEVADAGAAGARGDAPDAPAAPISCRNGTLVGCPSNLPACDENGFCVGCTTAFDCRGAAPACDVGAKTCVECLVDSDCHDAARPVCDGATGSCRGCTSSASCGAREVRLPVCDVVTGACVGCALACSGATPTCEAGACRACRRDADCAGASGPAICLDDVGRCATDSEVLYVEERPSCGASGATRTGTGTTDDPFCAAPDAVSALTVSRRVIVLRGPSDISLSGLALSFTAAPVFVVGQRNVRLTADAELNAGGVVIRAGDVSLRGFTISGTGGGGVVATGGTLRMSRMRIMDTNGEAIHTENANFDIVNTIIARNPQGADLGANPPNGPHRFAFNTSADNRNFGVSCQGQGDLVVASIVVNNASAIDPLCMTDAATPHLPAFFDRTRDYHLTATSPCVGGAADVADVPIEDVDGDLRPQGTSADCGADELVP